MKTLSLDLGERSYPIYIDRGLLGQGVWLTSHIGGNRVVIVTNETIAPLYLERVRASVEPYRPLSVVLPDGEQYKTLDVVNRIYDALLAAHCDRNVQSCAVRIPDHDGRAANADPGDSQRGRRIGQGNISAGSVG